jgi:hypothetical protein
MADMTGTDTMVGRVERVLTAAETQSWLRKAASPILRQPAAEWVGCLLEAAGDTMITCPGCHRHGRVPATLDHALSDHGLSFSGAAAWLESVDADLFSLAVHYLMSKDRSARTA